MANVKVLCRTTLLLCTEILPLFDELDHFTGCLLRSVNLMGCKAGRPGAHLLRSGAQSHCNDAGEPFSQDTRLPAADSPTQADGLLGKHSESGIVPSFLW
ncbi:hypothetical protein A249_40666 [Pseudomonas syringae pv. actinidiae ICMP 18804]|nr:hypothetical protein A249_40666 [Pseudomonas syringae pv. actinidiae ICMP 18804]